VRILKWLVVAVLLLIVGLIGMGLALPDTARIERSIFIDAKPATVYTVLNGFRQFNKWSPWAELDPDAAYYSEGPPVGVGAKHGWRSDDPAVGAGSQQIVEAQAHERIRMRLVFDGFDSENHATYTLTPEGEGTRLVWSYDSVFHGNLLGRYFGLMLDGMLGPDYERGLAKLKILVEALPQDDLSALEVELVELAAQPMVFISAAAPADEASAMLASAHAKLAAHLEAHDMRDVAAPIAITRAYDPETRAWRFDAARLVDREDPPAAPEQGIASGRIDAGLVARVVHSGPADRIEQTYQRLAVRRSVAGFEDNGDAWEQYGDEPAATLIYWPLR
jgi:DNA gyrase inhibitor GyrI/uncharacterized protein YndB with AHSA1/START domain